MSRSRLRGSCARCAPRRPVLGLIIERPAYGPAVSRPRATRQRRPVSVQSRGYGSTVAGICARCRHATSSRRPATGRRRAHIGPNAGARHHRTRVRRTHEQEFDAPPIGGARTEMDGSRVMESALAIFALAISTRNRWIFSPARKRLGRASEARAFELDRTVRFEYAREEPTMAESVTMRDGVEPYDVFHASAGTECDRCGEGDDRFDGVAHKHEFFVTREGAASRTADNLVAQFLEDVAGLTTYVVPDGLASPDSSEWCDDPDDAEALQDEGLRAESALSDAGLEVTWDDGYVIERVSSEE